MVSIRSLKGTIDMIDWLEGCVKHTLEMIRFCIDAGHTDMLDYYILEVQGYTDDSTRMVQTLRQEKP